MGSFENDINEVRSNLKIEEAKAEVEAAESGKKELKSILYKIHHATTEADLDTCEDRLAKGAVKHDFSDGKVSLLQKEVERKRTKIKAGDKEVETETATAEVEDKIDDAKDPKIVSEEPKA